jgi:hypothetical protein
MIVKVNDDLWQMFVQLAERHKKSLKLSSQTVEDDSSK